MEFTASTGGTGESYERPKPGKYLGVLIGFADIGTHDGMYGKKHKVMLRWELHKRKGPSLDSAGKPHTITARYNASLDAKSSLRQVVEAHIGKLTDGVRTSSAHWLGKAVWLDLEESTGNNNKTYTNVKSVSALDPEEDEAPKYQLPEEHWELSQLDKGQKPPSWAEWAVKASAEGDRFPWDSVSDGTADTEGGRDEEEEVENTVAAKGY